MCDSYISGNDRNVWNVVIKAGRIFMLRLHETASKSMSFGSAYTEPFSYSLRHAEVITDQRDLGTKKESTILFFSAWRKVACVASVSVANFDVLAARKLGREQKKERGGGGEERGERREGNVIIARRSTSRFTWTEDEVELLLKVTKEYKVSLTAEGVDWESVQGKYSNILDLFKEEKPMRCDVM